MPEVATIATSVAHEPSPAASQTADADGLGGSGAQAQAAARSEALEASESSSGPIDHSKDIEALKGQISKLQSGFDKERGRRTQLEKMLADVRGAYADAQAQLEEVQYQRNRPDPDLDPHGATKAAEQRSNYWKTQANRTVYVADALLGFAKSTKVVVTRDDPRLDLSSKTAFDASLKRIKDGVSALSEAKAKEAELRAAIKAEVEKEHAAKNGVDVFDGGSGGAASSRLTPARYREMTFDERRKLKATPEGRAQIDRMLMAR
jgi:septal ring factor EnvC (AmiA/AmiB activator)